MLNSKLKHLKRLIEDFVSENKIPGLSAHIVSNGQSLFAYGYGYSDIESKKAMQQDTVSSIMSISKSVTSIAMLQLAENHNFDLDTPIIEYLPYFKTASGAYDKITSTHILSHTAGFPDDIWLVTLLDHELREFAKNLPQYQFIFKRFPNIEEDIEKIKNREDVTKYFSTVDLTYEPSHGWLYCTDAYVILADIMEKVSGIPWEEYVIENILNPLNMNNTFINPKADSLQNISNYYLASQNIFIQLPTPNNVLGAPVGFIYSTANDMANYLISLMDNKNIVISDSSRSKMFSGVALREPGLSYGLGWKVKMIDGYKVVEHAGGYPSVSSFASMVPEGKFGVVLLCNTGDVPLQILSDKIIDLFYS